MKHVALIRGIMPTNPNTRGENLRKVFEELGFSNVATVIASGNVVFDSDEKPVSRLEEIIEKAFKEKLEFPNIVIVRSYDELKKLVAKAPFKGIKDEKPNYLIVTFFKDGRAELPTVINLNKSNSPDFMQKAEKEYGKEITTRTWKTVGRIIKVMEKKN